MKRHHGFTLIEIAIVIVVISMVVAGILAARSLIRNSQIQGVMSEYQMYSTAISSFKNKYLALPGDFSEATTLWGEASEDCKAAAATGTATCNGDGDGKIEFDDSNYEHIAAWRHLGLSGFINENHTGNTISGGACDIDIRGGENAPASRLKGGIWNIGSNSSGTPYTTGAAGDQYFPINTCNNSVTMDALWLGGSLQDDNSQAASCAGSQMPVLTGEEAYLIDKKYDNKRSITGKIRAQYNNSATYETCVNSDYANGRYNVESNGISCALVFMIDP